MNTPGEWRIYHGTGAVAESPITEMPEAPPWRRFAGRGVQTRPEDDGGEGDRRVGRLSHSPRTPNPNEVAMVNSAIYLRRPLLVSGNPGTGKSSLAYLVSRELGLGPVLRWPVTSRTTLRDGLYAYDAIGRVQAAGAQAAKDMDSDIGEYIHLGPLGTALLPYDLPRVLLIDELDKGDIDLPNDLLNAFEDGDYEITELVRYAKRQPDVEVLTADSGGTALVHRGVVRCREFPIVIITSNGEREFPPAFLRRCLRLELGQPDFTQLSSMISAHFGAVDRVDVQQLVQDFLARSSEVGGLASDQLLNAVHLALRMATSAAYEPDEEWVELLRAVWHPLTTETT